MKITRCRFNHLRDPLGFFYPQSTFSWIYEDVEKEIVSSRILVYEGKRLIHDTGYEELDPLSVKLPLSLRPRTVYMWKVFAKDADGRGYEGEENYFETGKMDEAWAGKWISCDSSQDRHPVFTKEFSFEKPVASARLYICGLGLYEARINGKKVSDEYLTPYSNNYHAFVQAETFDVTEYLNEDNRIEVELGNGWYKGRFGFNREMKPHYGNEWKLIAELRVRYEDGDENVIATDDSWTVKRSNITFSNIYDGEHRDDTLPEESEEAVYTQAPEGKLTDRYSLPVRAHEVLKPKELITTPKEEKVFDIGQNLAGIFRLKLRVPYGTRVHIRTGEVLQDDCFYQDNLRTAKSEYIYVSDGKEKVLEPKFTFYGFRYVCVDGVDDLKIDDLEAVALYSDYEYRGEISTGNDKIDQLISNAYWGMKSNFLDVPTDCPQRDERMGWTGDTEVFAPTAMYIADATAFYEKFLYDTYSEQLANDGGVPNVVPSFGMKDTAAAWGDVATILPMVLYEYEGDVTILERHYPSMKAWTDYITRLEENGHQWRKKYHFGDWLALDGNGDTNGATDTDFVASVYYLKSIRLTKKAAKLLNKREDEEELSLLEEKVLREIRNEYYSATGRSCIDTQTAYLLALDNDLSPDHERMKDSLVRRLGKDGYSLKTGFIGTPMLLEGLSRIGHDDLAYDLLFNEEYPGWLYCVNLGATTIWERWNSMLEDGRVSSTGMNSFNHYAFGSVISWIYERAAGFRQKKGSVGFRNVEIAPALDHRLGHIDMSFDSPSGLYRTGWKILDNNTLSFYAHIPYGCTAEVTLPLLGEERDQDVFRYMNDGKLILSGGDYEITYRTSHPIRKTYSADNTLTELLKSAEAKTVLTEKMPQMLQLPESMRDIPLKHIIAQFVPVGTDETIAMINDILKDC